MPSRVIRFGDWDKGPGDFGRTGAQNAPPHSFTGNNVLVNRQGEIHVRPGVRDVSPTGLVNGTVQMLGNITNDATNDQVWFAQGVNPRIFTPRGGTPSSPFTFTSGSANGKWEAGAQSYIVTSLGGCYRLPGGAVTSSPNGASIALYGDRLIIATANQIKYSDPLTGTGLAWGTGGTITIGGNDNVAAVVAQRTHLAILKTGSTFYVLTGVPSVNEIVRPVVKSIGPFIFGPSTGYGVTRSERIWWLSGKEVTPAMFDGNRTARPNQISFPDAAGGGTSFVPFRGDDPEAFAILQFETLNSTAQKLWLYNRGVWTQHSFGVTLNGNLTASLSTGHADDEATTATLTATTKLIFSDGGAAAAKPVFYSWMPDIDRPGIETDVLVLSGERAGDNSATKVTGTFSTPQWRSDDGSDVKVRHVTVIGRTWKTGGSTSNHFDLTVNALHPYDGTTAAASATQSFDQADALSDIAGQHYRTDFSFGDQGPGEGFTLSFTNMRGVSILSIAVTVETVTNRFGA